MSSGVALDRLDRLSVRPSRRCRGSSRRRCRGRGRRRRRRRPTRRRPPPRRRGALGHRRWRSRRIEGMGELVDEGLDLGVGENDRRRYVDDEAIGGRLEVALAAAPGTGSTSTSGPRRAAEVDQRGRRGGPGRRRRSARGWLELDRAAGEARAAGRPGSGRRRGRAESRSGASVLGLAPARLHRRSRASWRAAGCPDADAPARPCGPRSRVQARHGSRRPEWPRGIGGRSGAGCGSCRSGSGGGREASAASPRWCAGPRSASVICGAPAARRAFRSLSVEGRPVALAGGGAALIGERSAASGLCEGNGERLASQTRRWHGAHFDPRH